MGDYPLIPVGKITLNRNPTNYHAETDRLLTLPPTWFLVSNPPWTRCCRAVSLTTLTPTVIDSVRTTSRFLSTAPTALRWATTTIVMEPWSLTAVVTSSPLTTSPTPLAAPSRTSLTLGPSRPSPATSEGTPTSTLTPTLSSPMSSSTVCSVSRTVLIALLTFQAPSASAARTLRTDTVPSS